MIRCVAMAGLLAANVLSLLPSLERVSPLDSSDDETYVLRTDVRLVLLDVSVKDHAGAFVSGLTKDDFSVFENGRAQQIKVFTNRDLPVTAGVLVDASYSMTPKRYEALKAAELFIRESNPQDEMFVLTFNDKVRRGLPEGVLFSSDMKQLHEALFRGKPIGKTALNDAVVAGLKQLEKGTRDRRTLVLISDGGDNVSEHTRQELLRLVEGSVTTIYAIGIYEPGSQDQDPSLLRKLAKVSGGEAYFPTSPEQMSEICDRIAKDIRQRYTVGYTPSGPVTGADDLRQIRLKVKGPGNAKLIAKARTSYRYDQIESHKPPKHAAR